MGSIMKGKLLRGLLGFVVFVLATPFLIALAVFLGFFGKVPGTEDLKNIQNNLSSQVYSIDGRLLGKYYLYDRTAVRFEELPEHLTNALIATEDARFFEHQGIDYRSLARVMVRTIILQQKESGGGSTLTQQLAKNIYPRKDYGFLSLPVNKFREMIVARRLENAYSKEQIIALYLNTVPFGDHVFGIEAATKRFFNSTAKDLSIENSAVLIGMLKGSYLYNPRIFPERAKERRNVVLYQMHKYGYLNEKELGSLKELPVVLEYTKLDTNEGIATYFREQLRRDLLEWCKNHKKPDGENYDLYTDGLKIYTTINYEMQSMAEKATREHLSQLQAAFEKEWGKGAPWLTDSSLIKSVILRSSVYKKLASQGYSWKQVLDSLRQPRNTELFDWEGEKTATSNPIDSLLYHIKFLHTGFLAMEPHTGAVNAWVGGIDHEYFQYDHVNIRTRRQVGSTFKPIVYASALENGVRPCQFFSSRQVTYSDLEDWSPSNNDENYGDRYSLKGALAHSVNTVSVKVIEKTGISPVVKLAKALNIESDLPEVPSLALGTAEVSLVELAGAYAAFLNEGKPVKAHYIVKITDREGNVLEEFVPEEFDPAFSVQTGQMMVDMMRSVVNEGTASRLRWKYGVNNDIAGKTGTTQHNKDGWFVGMLPGLVTVTWVGADDPRVYFKSTSLGQGGSSALPIFASFVKQLNQHNSFVSLTKEKFPELSPAVRSKLDCENTKEGQGFFSELFNKEKDERVKEFGDGKNGIFKKLRGLFKKN